LLGDAGADASGCASASVSLLTLASVLIVTSGAPTGKTSPSDAWTVVIVPA
jgi:hypothetical protein